MEKPVRADVFLFTCLTSRSDYRQVKSQAQHVFASLDVLGLESDAGHQNKTTDPEGPCGLSLMPTASD